jgi:hypothetical protein
MRYGPDEIHRRGRPFEFPKVIGPMMLLDMWDIRLKHMGNIQGRLQDRTM